LKSRDQLLDTQTVPNNDSGNDSTAVLGPGHWEKNGQICSIYF